MNRSSLFKLKFLKLSGLPNVVNDFIIIIQIRISLISIYSSFVWVVFWFRYNWYNCSIIQSLELNFKLIFKDLQNFMKSEYYHEINEELILLRLQHFWIDINPRLCSIDFTTFYCIKMFSTLYNNLGFQLSINLL